MLKDGKMTSVRAFAARDIENCLEDLVSIYEAVLRALFTRCLRGRGVAEEELQSILAKKIANRFQNVRFSGEIIERELGLNPFETTSEQTFRELVHTFEKRHPSHTISVSLTANTWSGCVPQNMRAGKSW
jgi:hypothetical protein